MHVLIIHHETRFFTKRHHILKDPFQKGGVDVYWGPRKFCLMCRNVSLSKGPSPRENSASANLEVTSWGMVNIYHSLRRVLNTIPGCLGFLKHQQYVWKIAMQQPHFSLVWILSNIEISSYRLGYCEYLWKGRMEKDSLWKPLGNWKFGISSVDVLNKKVVLSWIFSHVFLLILLLFEIETTPGINCKQVEQLLKKNYPKNILPPIDCWNCRSSPVQIGVFVNPNSLGSFYEPSPRSRFMVVEPGKSSHQEKTCMLICPSLVIRKTHTVEYQGNHQKTELVKKTNNRGMFTTQLHWTDFAGCLSSIITPWCCWCQT